MKSRQSDICSKANHLMTAKGGERLPASPNETPRQGLCGSTVLDDAISSRDALIDNGIVPPSNNPRAAEIQAAFAEQSDPIWRARLAAEYKAIREREIAQLVENAPAPGRPGILSMVARELALPGKTEGAKRIWLERALKIATIQTTVISVAQQDRLKLSQTNLLEIAGVGHEEAAQRKKVEELVQRQLERKHGPKLSRSVVRYPLDLRGQVLPILKKLAEELGVELL